MYRILRRIDCGKRGVLEAGTLSTLDWVKEKHLDSLKAVDAISVVSAPPLKVLPGMRRKAKKYGKVGIEDASDLLKSDTKEVAKILGVDEEVIDGDKGRVQSYLTADKPEGG